MDQLRADLKKNLFDVVYFLDADRIARDVVYQNLIIAEILKYDKRIVIKGVDYVQNPENKFTLTVLGAVSELERAKIVERSRRGKREKARQGYLMQGQIVYGYTYIHKTNEEPGHFIVNEQEAEVVRLLYETYANTETSLTGLIKIVEEKGVKTKKGKAHWTRSAIRGILRNTTYYGTQYCNRYTRLETLSEHGAYLKGRKSRQRERDRQEWIAVPVPAIIDKELFDRVQAKIARHYKNTRNLYGKYLLGSLLRCGECGHAYVGYTRYSSNGTTSSAYRCNEKRRSISHLPHVPIKRCKNAQVAGRTIENVVWNTVENAMLNPAVMKKHVEILNMSSSNQIRKSEKDIKALNTKLARVEYKKKRILDLYADGTLSKSAYTDKVAELDTEMVALEEQRAKIASATMDAQQRKDVIRSVDEYCKLAKTRLKNLKHNQKREFLLTVLDSITYAKQAVDIKGFIPISESGTLKDSDKYCTRVHGRQRFCAHNIPIC